MKKEYYYITALALSAFYYFVIRKKEKEILPVVPVVPVNPQNTGNSFDENDFAAALRQLKIQKGLSKDKLADIEKIYRRESGNFQSGQYKKCGSAGWVAWSNGSATVESPVYPYGFTTVRRALWDNNPNVRPTGFVKVKPSFKPVSWNYIVFPTVYAAMLAMYVNAFERWDLNFYKQAGTNWQSYMNGTINYPSTITNELF